MQQQHTPTTQTGSSSNDHGGTLPTANDSDALLLRPIEAARLLALSPRKLWELTSTKEIPSVRIGRSIRYVREELKTWVESRRGVKTDGRSETTLPAPSLRHSRIP